MRCPGRAPMGTSNEKDDDESESGASGRVFGIYQQGQSSEVDSYAHKNKKNFPLYKELLLYA